MNMTFIFYLDHCLGDFDVGFLGWHQVCFIAAFPLKETIKCSTNFQKYLDVRKNSCSASP